MDSRSGLDPDLDQINSVLTPAHDHNFALMSDKRAWVRYSECVHCYRWKAEYRLIPDEQHVIEATLKQMVRH